MLDGPPPVEPAATQAHAEAVLSALKRLRVMLSESEHAVVRAIAAELDRAGIRYKREVVLGPRNRIDFLAHGGVGIEVKKGKPNAPALAAQAERYATFPQVRALVLVVERNVQSHPSEAHGKPVHYVALHKQWGLAL